MWQYEDSPCDLGGGSVKKRGWIAVSTVVALSLVPVVSVSGDAQAATQPDSTFRYAVIPFNPPSTSSVSSAGPLVVNPNCTLRLDYPHTTTVNGREAVKVNATASCSNGSIFDQVTVNVQLWKTGAIWDYLQASTSLSATYVYSFSNQGTWKYCANNTQSTFYGVASSTATIDGVSGWSAGGQGLNFSLDCGT